MVIKRRDFQKAAAFIHEFLLKMNEDVECAELRDTLNLALLHMQKYYRTLQSRSQEKNAQHTLSLSARGLSPMTPFVDAPDKFRWRWVNLDSARLPSNMSTSDSINLTMLPPMIRAVKAGNVGIMQELVKQDPATVDDIDGIGRSGIMYAVHCGEHNALNFLLENKADVNLTAHDGSTAMHHACHEGNVVALSLLLDHGANMSVLDVQGRAPIHWAVTTPTTECLEMLLENCVDPATRDKDGLTPCMWACRMDNIKSFELLCRSEYTISEHDGIERDANGRTWMHWAVRRTEPLECLQTLLTPESASYKDEEGKTVLMLAAEIGSLPATRLIIEIAGAECVHDRDYQGRNALHLATIGGHGDVVNFLLEQGADINIADHYNATPWDYARHRQLHYCQLIIMSHQRQRMMSNPTSPLPNGLGLLINSENGVQEDFSRMSFRTRSEQSTPITPPHPPKRPRTNRMLQRRANSLTTPDRDQNRDTNQNYPGRISNSAGHERKKERLEVSVNTRSMANTEFLRNRQDSTMTDDTDMMNVMNDVDINGDDDIDNVSVGGMDVSDIEDNDQNNNTGDGVNKNRPVPTQRPPGYGRQQQGRGQQHQQPRPPVAGGYRNPQPHPPTTAPAPSYTRPLEPQYNQDQDLTDLADDGHSSQPMPLHPPPSNKPSYSPQAPPRPTLRTQQQYRGGRGSVPSPPNTDPQRPHMIRQQQPLPPQPIRQANRQQPPAARSEQLMTLQVPPGGAGDAGRGEQVVSPPLSSQSSDQISSRTQISVGVGPSAGGTGGGGGGVSDRSVDQTRPNSGGNKPPGVLEGRRIPPPMLTPLPNAPKPPGPSDLLDRSGEKEKKKKKKKKGRGVNEKEREVKSPPQNPLEISPPRGYAAPLHPQQGRIHSAVPPPPKYSKGQPQHHDSRFVDENVEEDDKPPVINGYAVPIREGTMKSARPGQRSIPMETDDSTAMSTEVNDSTYHADGVKESIAEEEEAADELGMGPLIPPPQAFRGASQQGGRPLSQSVPQDKSSMRMVPTSAKPPLPRGNRNSASITRRSGEKNVSPGRRSRPPTSKSAAHS